MWTNIHDSWASSYLIITYVTIIGTLKSLKYLNFHSSLACNTIGGPDPYQRCIFPFIWNGQTYYGCPVDPNNNAFRWCSTKVDEYGYHVSGQGRYGYCDDFCPIHPRGPFLNTQPPNNNGSNHSGDVINRKIISVVVAFGILVNVLQRLEVINDF